MKTLPLYSMVFSLAVAAPAFAQAQGPACQTQHDRGAALSKAPPSARAHFVTADARRAQRHDERRVQEARRTEARERVRRERAARARAEWAHRERMREQLRVEQARRELALRRSNTRRF